MFSKIERGQGKVLETRNVRETKEEMNDDFNISRLHNLKLSKCVWHTSLSFPDDVSDQQMCDIAKEWMEPMDLLETQWAIFLHTDTKIRHVHIVASRIADDGHTISDSNNYKRSEAICRQLEIKHNLQRLPDVRQEQNISQGKLRGRDAFKSECHLAIQDVLKRSRSVEEFNVLMKNEKGIDCLWTKNPDDSVRGLSFSNRDQKIKGSDINRLYSGMGILNYIQYKNEKRTNNEIKSAQRSFKNSLYQLKESQKNQNGKFYSVEDDIIAIDKILNLNQRKKIRYGR